MGWGGRLYYNHSNVFSKLVIIIIHQLFLLASHLCYINRNLSIED